MKAALVPLVVALPRHTPHEPEHLGLVGRRSGQVGQRDRTFVALGGEEDGAREVLAPVDVPVLGDEILFPERAGGLELRIAERFEKVGSGEVQRHAAIVRNDAEVERLCVDAELVSPELDRVIAVLKEVGAIAEPTEGILLLGLEARDELVGFDRIAELPKLLADLLQLQHHRVGREVGVRLIERGESPRSAADRREDSLGSRREVRHAALARVEQCLFSSIERVDDFFPFGRDVGQVLVELAEATLKLFEREHEAGHLFVALLGRIGERERRLHGLTEEDKLGPELGATFPLRELLAPPFQRRANTVHLREHLADALEDRGPGSRIVDLQRGDDLTDDLEPGADRIDALPHAVGVGRLLDLRDVAELLLERRGQSGERLGALKETDTRMRNRIESLDRRRLERLERCHVDVPGVPNGDQVPPVRSKPRERGHERIDGGQTVRQHVLDRVDVHLACFGQNLGGLSPKRDDLLELVNDPLGAAANLLERTEDWTRLGRLEPVEVVEHAAVGAQQVLVELPSRRRVLDHADDREGLGDAPDQLGVTDSAVERVVGWGVGCLLRADERSLPYLHRMHGHRLGVVTSEDDETAVVEDAVSVARNLSLHLLPNQVVGEQEIAPVGRAVEDVEHVFAVRRPDLFVNDQVGQLVAEELMVAGLQVVPAGEDDTVLLRELETRLANRVRADHGLRSQVEDEVTPDLLVVWSNPEQNQAADLRVLDARVVERLVRVVDAFRVDALPALGVVLDLDRQVAADTFHEDLVEDRHMRVAPFDVVVAGRLAPAERVSGRVCMVLLAAVVDVLEAPVGQAIPAEHTQVARGLSVPEDSQQLGRSPPNLLEPRFAVVLIEVDEVLGERWVDEEAAPGCAEVDRRKLDAFRRLGEAVQAEDIAGDDLLLHPDQHVVAEEQVTADVQHVARDALVLGPHSALRDDAQLGRPERLGPLSV